MTPVGGPRHYVGGGLGQEGGWDCPSCGSENMGPIAQGCVACGAGRPGRHVGMSPPPPPAAPDEITTPPATVGPEPEVRRRDLATIWAEEHPDADREEGFRAGFLEGVRQARMAQLREQQALDQQPQPTRPAVPYVADDMIQRTVLAALEHFRDHVLVSDPEETTTGEWLTQHQVTALIAQMRGEVHG